MLGFLVSGGEEFNLGPMMRLDHLQFLCDKVLLKYKREAEEGRKSAPLIVFSNMLYTYQQAAN